MSKLVFVLGFTFCIASLNSQAVVKVDRQGGVTLNDEDDDIRGSKYLYKDWVEATIIDTDDKMITDVSVNYNGYTKKFEMLERGNKKVELNSWLYQQINVYKDKKMHTFKLYKDGDTPAYFKVIYEGEKASFLEKFDTKLKVDEIPNYGSSTSTKKYLNRKSTYIYTEGNLIEVKRKDKDIVKVLGKKELKKYIKENKLKIKEDKDLSALFEYHESL